MRNKKVIQFGEGGFLRGFVDWMLQIVNEKTDFNGSVTVVQPIKNGLCDVLTEQGCTYTHLCRGVEGVDVKKIDVIENNDYEIESINGSWVYTTYVDGKKVSIISSDLKHLKEKVSSKNLPFHE